MNPKIESIECLRNKKEMLIPIPKEGFGFIYHLIDDKGVIVYIGKTTNVLARVGVHLNTKKFSKCTYFEVSIDELDDIEADEILLHWPILNGAIPCNSKYLSIGLIKKEFPFLKGKANKIKKIFKSLNIRGIHGYYTRSEIMKMISIFEGGFDE